MADTVWTLSSSDGALSVTTGVAGPAAKMGHRLTLAMPWQASVRWADEPSSMELTVDVGSLEVLRGEGGVTPLSSPEKALARSNALKTLKADRYPHVVFRSDRITKSANGYRLEGTLEINGRTRDRVVDLAVEDLGDRWGMSTEAVVRQSDFGVKPYSMMMGAMKVADEVTVAFSAQRAKSG
ncbi:YceI family protein [Mycobacterium sp. smrl_JER01]|uniref:YceI family protein n=1 Tax=Mycobacterium sp. smrl_JER01 TaxID=3402633 RepID=UPI003AC40DC6